MAEDVPAGIVDPGLHVELLLDRGIHSGVDRLDHPGVLSDQYRREFFDHALHAPRKGRQIVCAPRAHLAPAQQPRIRLDRENSGFDGGDRTLRAPVRSQRDAEVDFVAANFPYLHGHLRTRFR